MLDINKIYHGDCLQLFKQLDNESIDSVITSPPYWQLRDYKWGGQWGLEPTFQEYLEHLWQMMDEVYRVLKPTGTAWINLGDTYNGNGNNNGTGAGTVKQKDGVNQQEITKTKGKEPDKCLLLIPHRFAIGCIDRGWIVRNDIVWAKRNGMPESVTDRFSKKHEYFFFMVKNSDYYFDLDGIKDSIKTDSLRRYQGTYSGRHGQQEDTGMSNKPRDSERQLNGKNPGDVSDFWDILTKGSSDEHYAAYNDKLIGKPIVSGSSQYVCNKCGKPRQKIFEAKEVLQTKENTYATNAMGKIGSGWTKTTFNGGNNRAVASLSDCGCNEGFSGGIILDPFCGTATTGCRALELGRRFIGFEGSDTFVDMGNRNLQPYLLQTKLF